MKIVNIYITIFVIFIAGCTSVNHKTIEKDIKIERISSTFVNVATANVYRTDEGLIISGKLKLNHQNTPRGRYLPGHVDIEISDPEGKVIFETKTNYISKAYSGNSRVFKFSYSADIPSISYEGKTIRVSFHEA